MFKAAAGGRPGIPGQYGQVLVDFFGINLLGKFAEMNNKQGDS